MKKFSSLFFFIISYNLILFLQYRTQEVFQVYLFGFRFNLFLIVNLVLIYFNRKEIIPILKELKIFGNFSHWLITFITPIIISTIVIFLAYFFGKIKYNEPDFVIEFAGTLLIDLPMYLIWNLPLLISLLILIRYFIGDFNLARILFQGFLLNLAIVSILLSTKDQNNILGFSIVNAGFIFYNLFIFSLFRSYWLSALSILLSIYSYVVVMGSNNKFIIKTFFARMYDNWQGLFKISFNKQFPPELLFGALFILFGFIFFILKKKN